MRRGFLRWRKSDSDLPFWKRKNLLSPRTKILPCSRRQRFGRRVVIGCIARSASRGLSSGPSGELRGLVGDPPELEADCWRRPGAEDGGSKTTEPAGRPQEPHRSLRHLPLLHPHVRPFASLSMLSSFDAPITPSPPLLRLALSTRFCARPYLAGVDLPAGERVLLGPNHDCDAIGAAVVGFVMVLSSRGGAVMDSLEGRRFRAALCVEEFRSGLGLGGLAIVVRESAD
jgi:hypothetical protein